MKHRTRTAQLDWARLAADLDQFGCATTGPLLTTAECAAMIGSYEDDALFRKHVVMARHGYGQGNYKYFDYPRREPRQHAAGREPLAQWAAVHAGDHLS